MVVETYSNMDPYVAIVELQLKIARERADNRFEEEVWKHYDNPNLTSINKPRLDTRLYSWRDKKSKRYVRLNAVTFYLKALHEVPAILAGKLSNVEHLDRTTPILIDMGAKLLRNDERAPQIYQGDSPFRVAGADRQLKEIKRLNRAIRSARRGMVKAFGVGGR